MKLKKNSFVPAQFHHLNYQFGKSIIQKSVIDMDARGNELKFQINIFKNKKSY